MTLKNSGLVLVLMLCVLGPLAWLPAAESIARPQGTDCDCSHLEVLTIELKNALLLQKNFRSKIPELRAMNGESATMEMQKYAATEVRNGLEDVPGYKGPGAVDYEPHGANVSDPLHPKAGETNETLCRMTDSAQATLTAAMKASACNGIGKALEAHEDVHRNSCLRRGFAQFFLMHGADRAQEEVDAYEAQIQVLRAEIERILQSATIKFDMKTRTEYASNPVFAAVIINSASEVKLARAGTTGDFRLDGQGTQDTTVAIEGNCRVKTQMPITLPARASLEIDGKDAIIRYTVEGTFPSVGMDCQVPGMGQGTGMSMPVPVSPSKIPVIRMRLRDGSEVTEDLSQSEAAKILAGGGAVLKGTGTIRLVCAK